MAFTGRLGASDSKLGNITLGAIGGGGAINNDTLTIDGTASVALAIVGTYNPSLTVNASAAVSTAISTSTTNLTITVNASGAYTCAYGAGTSTIPLTVNASAAVGLTLVASTGMSLTVNASAAVTPISAFGLVNILTIAASGSVAFIDGQTFPHFMAIEGIADISYVFGFVYQKTLSVDATASFTQTNEHFQLLSITVDGTASFALDVVENVRASLTVAGTAAFSIIQTMNQTSILTLSAQGSFFVEQIYDVLIVSAAIATLTMAGQRVQTTTENPGATGSFAASCQASFRRTIRDSLVITESIRVKKTTGIIRETINFVETIGFKRVRLLTVTDTLTFSELRYSSRGTHDTLHFSETINVVRSKAKTRSDVLTFHETIFVNKVLNRTVTDTLIFNPPRETRLPLISGGTPFAYYKPSIDFVLVPRRCLVIISVPSQSVVLPCPLFGDNQAYQGELTVKRTMIGGTRTYVKQTQLQILEYTFDLWTDKYLELANFVNNHSHQQIRMDNWKGETWIVNLMNNPVEFSAEGRYQPKGERYSVKLQFQGVKING